MTTRTNAAASAMAAIMFLAVSVSLAASPMYAQDARPPRGTTIPAPVTPSPRLYLPVIQKQPPPTPTAPPKPDALVQPVNGDFEKGDTPEWKQLVSDTDGLLIFSVNDYPLAGPVGSFYGWLGGAKSQTNRLSQTVVLARNHQEVVLIFDYWVASQETTCAGGGDEATFGAGTVQSAPVQLCKANNTYDASAGHGWRTMALSIGPGTGQAVDVTFFTTLDGDDSNSNFYLNNIRLCSKDPDARQEDKCP